VLLNKYAERTLLHLLHFITCKTSILWWSELKTTNMSTGVPGSIIMVFPFVNYENKGLLFYSICYIGMLYCPLPTVT